MEAHIHPQMEKARRGGEEERRKEKHTHLLFVLSHTHTHTQRDTHRDTIDELELGITERGSLLERKEREPWGSE